MPAKAQRGARSQPALKGIPKLEIDPKLQQRKTFDPEAVYKFRYAAKGHRQLPHIMKFSGGRSSGMLLFTLLEGGILRAERGDAIIFNNTSAEHPETYEFTRRCQEEAENRYGIPFFWIEFQTYEDARQGQWARLPSYRMTNNEPWSEENPAGYHWKGETFEEMLSLRGFVPNQFSRVCTLNLKLETTRAFLHDWLANKEGIERLGHYGEETRIEAEEIVEKHKQHRGGVPEEILLAKKEYLLTRPVFRPEQKFREFSPAVQEIQNKILDANSYGGRAEFGTGEAEYVSFIGLRHDEMHRVIKVQNRNRGGEETNGSGYQGEHVYMPLSNMGVTREDINRFWAKQSWNLGFASDDELSNCVFCFLKGARKLQKVRSGLAKRGMKGLEGTPSDVQWWKEIESKYGRDLVAEGRETKNDIEFIGFFGVDSGFSYAKLASGDDLSQFDGSVLPCDCTD